MVDESERFCGSFKIKGNSVSICDLELYELVMEALNQTLIPEDDALTAEQEIRDAEGA